MRHLGITGRGRPQQFNQPRYIEKMRHSYSEVPAQVYRPRHPAFSGKSMYEGDKLPEIKPPICLINNNFENLKINDIFYLSRRISSENDKINNLPIINKDKYERKTHLKKSKENKYRQFYMAAGRASTMSHFCSAASVFSALDRNNIGDGYRIGQSGRWYVQE